MSESEYLGFGLGLGAQVNEQGRLQALVRYSRMYPLEDLGSDHRQLISRPTSAHRLASAGPGEYRLPDQLKYVFSGENGERTLRIFPADERLLLEFRPDHGAEARLELHASHGWRPHLNRPGEATTVLCGEHRDRLEVTVRADSDVTAVLDGNVASWIFPREATVEVVAKPVSVFAPSIVIAGTLEMAAVLSSCFHDPDAYVAVFPLSEIGSSSRAQRSMDLDRQHAGAEGFIFGGVPPEIVDEFLWDKPPEFRARTKVFQNADEVAHDPIFGGFAEFRCPARALPLGVLAAKESGCRVVVDERAPAPMAEPRRCPVISYEAVTFDAIVAANLAHFQGAQLMAAADVNAALCADLNGRVQQLQERVPDRKGRGIPAEIDELRRIVRSAARLNLSSATELTAFTQGIPYCLGYDLPVAHILTPGAADFVFRDLVRRETAGDGLPVSLLVDTLEFGQSEVFRSLPTLSRRGPALVMQGPSASKLAMLEAMLLLPLTLQVIVAHGAREVFFSEKWTAKSAGGESEVEVKNSSREIPDLGSARPQGEWDLLSRKSRVEVGRASYINGVQLSDALVTDDDLRMFGARTISGLVLNNGCATWSSLARAFTTWAARGYIGTLWPVGNFTALSVGGQFLVNERPESYARLLWKVTRGLHPADQCNYAFVGLADFHAVPPPPTTRLCQLFATILIVESQFQAAAELSRSHRDQAPLADDKHISFYAPQSAARP